MTTETLIDRSTVNDTRKEQLLSSPVEHIDITKFDARPIIDAMGHMSFTSRDLARATGIYNQMLQDPACSIILVIAGSTSAGGCMDLYADLLSGLHRQLSRLRPGQAPGRRDEARRPLHDARQHRRLP